MARTRLMAFQQNESGAVTVDWAVLSAVVIGTAISIIATLSNGTHNLASNVENAMNTASIIALGTPVDDDEDE